METFHFTRPLSSFNNEEVYAEPGAEYDIMESIPERHERFWDSLNLDDSFNMPGMTELMHTHYIIMRAIRNNITVKEATKMGGNWNK